MTYAIEVLPSALRQLLAVPKNEQRRLEECIDRLAANPRPVGAKALQGSSKGHLRVRIGDYRIIYRVEDDRLLVLVVRVGHRKDVYRRR
jgi:mRNA interferase RelE/StbE